MTNPQSFNRYSYVENDPVNFVDPSGLEMSTCHIDGVQSDCGTAFGLIGSGAGVFGPASTTRWNPSANNGQGGFEFFRAYASGNSGWYDMQGYSVTVTANLHLDGYGSWFAGSAVYANASNFDFSNRIMATRDQWPPEWPKPSRTFKWAEPPSRTTSVRLPGGEPVNMNPSRGVPSVEVRPKPPMPGIDPENPRLPTNPSLWDRINYFSAQAMRAMSNLMGKTGHYIIVPNPQLFLEQRYGDQRTLDRYNRARGWQ